jgi:hypothetical protein
MTAAPRRIHFARLTGVQLPPGARLVTRGGRRPADPRRSGQLGNYVSEARRHTVEEHRRAAEEYRAWAYADGPEAALWREQVRRRLRGLDLACECPEGWPCHGDVLLEIANQD